MPSMLRQFHRQADRLAVTLLFASAAAGAGVDSVAAATWHVSPDGRGGACSLARPCDSFGAAYGRARPGDTVVVGGGTYPRSQIISGDKGSTRPVLVRAAAGQKIVITGGLDVRADYVRVVGPMRLARGLDIDDPNKANPIVGVRVSGVTAPSSYIENARDLMIAHSRLGGVPGQPIVMIGAWPTSYRIAFNKVSFYGNYPTDSSQHLECVFVTGVQGLAIRNSRFWDCGYFNILVGMCCGAQRQPSNLVLENNHFGVSRCFAGSGGCGSDGKAPFSLMLGTRIDGRSRIVGNHFETPPAVTSTFSDLVATGNTGKAPTNWKRLPR
jgi:hypothetical protein